MSATCTYWGFHPNEYLRERALGRPSDKHADAAAIRQTRIALDGFLAEIERKAFVMARMSLRHDEDAHDVVQDTMMRLVRKYADRPRDEWKPLFYRILKNRIVDQQRSRGVRQRFMAWLPVSEDAQDPIAEAPGHISDQPDHRLHINESMESLEEAVGLLPKRQQQAFLLRALEGLNVQETATVMGCSQGSVKTHFSRAVHRLRATLGDKYQGDQY